MDIMDHLSDRKSWLTAEHLIWALVAALALAMRVARLGAAPLAPAEAREALLAWRAATGHGMPLADYNPLLFGANSLLFTIFGASDDLARLLPALSGVGLALAPLLFRRQLGRIGALASALYLALSPTALVASRQLDGAVVASAGALAFLGGLLRFLHTERRPWLTFAALGLALGVTAGAAVYGVLIPCAFAYLTLSQLAPDGEPLVPPSAAARIARHAPRFLLTFAAAALLLGTALGWHIPGLGASAAHLADWLGRLRLPAAPPVSLLTLLATYELAAVAFGVGGLVWGLRQRRSVPLLLGLWAGLALLLLALMPGRAPTDALWALLPLALLAGLAVQALAREDPAADPRLRAAHLVIVLVLWAHAYLMLARYAWLGDRTDLALALIAVLLQALVGLSFGLIQGAPAAFRTAARGTAVAFLSLTLGAGWGVAYTRPTDPREVLFTHVTPANVRDLVRTLEDISWQETGMPRTLSFTVAAPQDSVLAWYLRSFPEARRVDHLGDLAASEIQSVVVTAGRDEPALAAADTTYAGQDFALRRRWSLRDIGCRFWEPGCNAPVEWFLFREGVPLPAVDQWATLWRIGELSHSP